MASLIISGSTGAIGSEVVVHAVNSDDFTRVVALSRRQIEPSEWPKTFGDGLDMNKARTKLQVVAVDWERLLGQSTTAAAAVAAAATTESSGSGDVKPPQDFAGAFEKHDYAANCLGTTRNDAGSAAAFWRVDHDFALAFARLVRAQSGEQLKHFAQVSSEGANSKSWFTYMQCKGKTDDDIISIGFPRVTVMRPGLLGRKEKARWVEKVAAVFVAPMPVGTVAAAILRAFKNPPSETFVGNSQITKLVA